MTDQSPSPTTRMPVPEPPTAGGDEPDDDRSAIPPRVPESNPPYPPNPSPTSLDPPVAPRARREERDHGRTASILFGLAILGIGLWFLAEHTLGIDMPTIRWNQVWPAILIVIGLWVVLGSMRRGSR